MYRMYIKEVFMVTISFTQFRQKAKSYFDTVEKGETVRIMRHGKIVAEIVSPGKRKKTAAEPLIIPGVSLSKVILEERGEERI